MEHIQIKELVEVITRALADDPSQIQVNEIVGQQISVLRNQSSKKRSG